MPLSNQKLLARDKKRDIGQEVLQAIRDVKAGKVGRSYHIMPNKVVETRMQCGLSQTQFAQALGISHRTLQQWEQGRRQPSGAAETLLLIIYKHPEVLKDVSTIR